MGHYFDLHILLSHGLLRRWLRVDSLQLTAGAYDAHHAKTASSDTRHSRHRWQRHLWGCLLSLLLWCTAILKHVNYVLSTRTFVRISLVAAVLIWQLSQQNWVLYRHRPRLPEAWNDSSSMIWSSGCSVICATSSRLLRPWRPPRETWVGMRNVGTSKSGAYLDH